MKIRTRAPGACGELVQGIVDGQHFLVTCPIDLYSEIEVELDLEQSIALPPDYQQAHPKITEAINKTFQYCGTPRCSYRLTVISDLPQGKGMASSSADISAACMATAISLGRHLSANEIADIALTIEPTDGIFYQGIAMFDHITGDIRRLLGNPPPIDIAVFDIGGYVDTVSFNRRQDLPSLNKAKESQVCEALKLVIDGIRHQDVEMIGRGATISALANQAILFKPELETMLASSLKLGAVGVNVAHSGTVVGVLFPAGNSNIMGCVQQILTSCTGVCHLKTVRLISGGLSHWEGEKNEWVIAI